MFIEKKKIEEPVVKVVKFDPRDVIATSTPPVSNPTVGGQTESVTWEDLSGNDAF